MHALRGNGSLRRCLRDGSDCCARQAAGKDAQATEQASPLAALLRRLRDHMERNRGAVEREFAAADQAGTRSGFLQGAQLLQFCSRALPGASRADVRLLLAHVNAWDVHRSGRVTLAEFRRSVGAAKPRIARLPGGQQPAALAPPPQQRQQQQATPAEEVWELYEIYIAGQLYLEDLKTGTVFDASAPQGVPFRPVGRRNQATGKAEVVDKQASCVLLCFCVALPHFCGATPSPKPAYRGISTRHVPAFVCSVRRETLRP